MRLDAPHFSGQAKGNTRGAFHASGLARTCAAAAQSVNRVQNQRGPRVGQELLDYFTHDSPRLKHG